MITPTLTIGLATYDDFDGVYFTITSLMIHHRETMSHCRFVVIDNNPDSQDGLLTRDWVKNRVPNGDYYPFREVDLPGDWHGSSVHRRTGGGFEGGGGRPVRTPGDHGGLGGP